MRGGNFGGLQKCCARQLAFAAIVGVLWSLSSDMTMQFADAADRVANSQRAKQSKSGQSRNGLSILVASSKLPSETRSVANLSEQEPDFARPVRAPDRPDPFERDSKRGDSSTGITDPKAESLSASDSASEVFNFHGVTPGVSSRRDVLQEWGDPSGEETAAETLLYQFDKLRSVRVKFDDDLVDAIVVEFDTPLATRKLVRKLDLAKHRPALLSDEVGTPLAQVYPERGVVLRYSEAEDQVGEIVIQPIKSAGFLLRAENNTRGNLSNCVEDLQEALRLDRTSTHARWLLSETYLKLGQAVSAERYAAEATEIEPLDPGYRLQHAKCLRQLARYDQAVDQARKVLESPKTDSLVRAQALHEMGLLSALGSKAAAQRAVPLHTKAIEIADRLAISDEIMVRQKARELLVEAHLAIAVEISRGAWKRKDQTVPQWIERASALSEEMILSDASNLPLRLQVAVSALAAVAGLESPVDPLLWIQEAEETAQLLQASTSDPKTRNQYDWQLGLAYFHGAQIQHRRSEPDSAERLGKSAVAKLGDLAEHRDQLPGTGYLLGRLYFQIGAVHAVHHNDHKRACRWYDQAVDYLLYPVPVTAMAAPQQHGDALVSMGVSYWHVKRHEEAIEVTQAGVDLIEQAVLSGLLQVSSLEVPYGNLAAMYEAQGETESAAKYTELAEEISESEISSKPLPQQRG